MQLVSITLTLFPSSCYCATCQELRRKFLENMYRQSKICTEFDTEKYSENEDDIDLIVEKYSRDLLIHLS